MSTTLILEIAQFVGAIAALIIIHEFGHFIASRLVGIEVEEFGLGFPPRMATLFELGGTKYTLNWLPLGGFVRPKGENDPSVEGGLAAARPWKRLVVLFSGPLANLLVGVLLYAMIITRVGVSINDQVQILEVAPNSPAAQAGLMAGDMILAVNDTPVNGMEDLQTSINDNLGQATQLTYQRNEETATVTMVPRADPPPGEGAIGIIMSNPTRQVSLISAIPLGVEATFNQISALATFPLQMIKGNVTPEEGRLVGFKGMFDIYQAVREPTPQSPIPAGVNVLAFFATITISLGVLNLMPIPALDGGRILFVLPEIFLGRRIPPQYENVINLVSFTLLILLLLYINLYDFINPIELTR
jgi:regulator of sigma E protease